MRTILDPVSVNCLFRYLGKAGLPVCFGEAGVPESFSIKAAHVTPAD